MRELYKKFDSKKFDEVLAKLNKIDINQKVNEHNFCYAYDDAEYKELKKKELYERINCLICMYDTDDIDVSILLQSINYLYKNIDDYYIDPRYKKLFFFFAFTKIKNVMESKNEKEMQVYNALYFLYDMYFHHICIDDIKDFLSNDYVIFSEEFDNEDFDINKYIEDVRKLIIELDEHSFYSYAKKDFKDAHFEDINLLYFYFIHRPFTFGEFNPFRIEIKYEILNKDGFIDNAIEYLNTVNFMDYKYHIIHDMNVERLEYIYFWTDDYLALDIFKTDADVLNLSAQYNYFKYLKTKDEKYRDSAISYMYCVVLSVSKYHNMTLMERTKTLFENMLYILFRECESYSDFEVMIYAIALKISDFRFDYVRYDYLNIAKHENKNGEVCYFYHDYDIKEMELRNYYLETRKNEIEKSLIKFGHIQNNSNNNEDDFKACKEELDFLKTLCYEFTNLAKDLKNIKKIQKIIDICTTLNINYILKFSKLKFYKYNDKGYENGFDIITNNTVIYEAIENIKLIYMFYYSRTNAKELDACLKLNDHIVNYINILKDEKKYDIIEQIIISLKEYINADDYENKLKPVLIESLHLLGKYRSCFDIFKEDSFTDYSLIVKMINISAERDILNTNIKIKNKNIILRIYEILTFSSKDLIVTSLFNFIKHVNGYIDSENNWDGRTVNVYYKGSDFILCYNYYVHNKKGKFNEKTKIAVSQLRNTLTHIDNDRNKVNEYIKEYKDAIEFTKTNYSQILECMFNVIKKNNILTRKSLNELYTF